MVRSLWLAVALALYCATGAVALLAWALMGAGTQLVWIAASGALWLVCSLLAGWFWRSAPSGVLVWSGADWTLESAQGKALCPPCTHLQVHLDLQRRLWLRLQPESFKFPVISAPAQSGPVLWLWLERRSQPLMWDDLRRAVYSRVGSGGPAAGPNASNIAPHSDPQA